MRLITRVAIFLIVCYQRFISPFTAPSCRFYPSCSQYSRDSFEKHGPVKGLFYSLVRLLKCHPFHPGGYDPVK